MASNCCPSNMVVVGGDGVLASANYNSNTEVLTLTTSLGTNVLASIPFGTVSILTDNGDGTFTHDDGNGNITTITFREGVSTDANNDLVVGTDGLPFFEQNLTTFNDLLVANKPLAPVAPSTVPANPIAGDTVIDGYSDGLQFWTYNGAGWDLNIDADTSDSKVHHQVEAGNAPVAGATPTTIPTNLNPNDTVIEFYDNVIRYWTYDGTTWTLDTEQDICPMDTVTIGFNPSVDVDVPAGTAGVDAHVSAPVSYTNTLGCDAYVQFRAYLGSELNRGAGVNPGLVSGMVYFFQFFNSIRADINDIAGFNDVITTHQKTGTWRTIADFPAATAPLSNAAWNGVNTTLVVPVTYTALVPDGATINFTMAHRTALWGNDVDATVTVSIFEQNMAIKVWPVN